MDGLFRQVGERIVGGVAQQSLAGLSGSAKWLATAELFSRIRRTQLIVTSDEKDAAAIAEDVSFFLGEKRVFQYPSLDILTTDIFAPKREAELTRMALLWRLLWEHPLIMVVSIPALAQKILPRQIYEEQQGFYCCGQNIDREAMIVKLVSGGYVRAPLVEEPGQFSIRGNIIDIFPAIYEEPRRLEFCGDEIELIKIFDPSSQRSIRRVEEVALAPVSGIIVTEERRKLARDNIRLRADELEIPATIRAKLVTVLENGDFSALNPLFSPLFYHEGANGCGLDTLFDYLPADSLVILDDSQALANRSDLLANQLDRFSLKANNEGKFHLATETFYLGDKELTACFSRYQRLFIEGPSGGSRGRREEGREFFTDFETESLAGIRSELMASAPQEGLLKPLVAKIRGWLAEGYLVTILSSTPEEGQRLANLFSLHGLPYERSTKDFFADLPDHQGRGRLTIQSGHLKTGFLMPLFRRAVLSEEEVFGRKTRRRGVKQAREGFFLQSLGEMQEGDFAVHIDHGIGIYRGLHKLNSGGIENDYLLLEYLEGAKIYVPVERMDVIQRYIGPAGYRPKLDKLGGSSWDAVRERVKKSIQEIAEELVALYATREVTRREPFSPPDALYEEFCSTFEYEETPDQAKSIEDIELDMEQSKPMDRLICGDAGFGKTEVAMRAAFRAVMDGKQVALMVPTTILAEQHYQTFSRRMAAFPLRVEVINRFKTKARQKEILEGLQKGMVDIIIGTHRLLQKDVKFKDLGLVVIDEEQRFGVSHKERLKQLRTQVDVLTLSATPIPRTLHLSLVGLRDLSIITTPPEGRIPIRTYVMEFNEGQIRDAIVEEMKRGGQVFFVHNRILSIYSMSRLIQKLVPEARISVVHGRMLPQEIEGEMARFIRKECDVLVCTSIIGSGIDIPSANSIIINRADHFGLSQLYQIRGRVGRSGEEAFAYLFVPKGAMLSHDARKRLQAMMDFHQPGSGFKIASNDLETRGAGNLLGTSQSGHVSAVGYEHYVELMEKVIQEMKDEVPAKQEEIKPEINLGVPAFLPESYMADMHRRLTTYKRISLAGSDEDLRNIREELRDCYGPLPAETENLLDVIAIRNILKVIRGKKMGYDGKNLYVFFHEGSSVQPERLVRLARKDGRSMRFTPDHRLYLATPKLNAPEIIKEARQLVRALAG